MLPDSNEPPATGVYWLVSPHWAKVWLSVWFPQAPGRIERTLAWAAGAAPAQTARVVAAATSAVRKDRFKVSPSSGLMGGWRPSYLAGARPLALRPRLATGLPLQPSDTRCIGAADGALKLGACELDHCPVHDSRRAPGGPSRRPRSQAPARPSA